ncbi:MAG: FadR family transcriptional regulator [Deltaproteobacteria bacterium]|nr:FadR family transcriptional regulator [Deltaproteobacteria bacterium]
MNLKPIKPKRISDQVFEQVRELILKGEFKSGQQILPERELAVSMAVSRTSVRNAINKLVTMGLLEHRQGQGTFVSSPDNRNGNPLAAAMATDEATLDDLLEVRMGLECNAAALAAQRAADTDLTMMLKSIGEMEDDLATTDRISTEADAAFHMAVAFATKNPVLIHLMRNFYDFLFIGIKKNLTHMYMDRNAMRTHIQYVQDYFRKR